LDSTPNEPSALGPDADPVDARDLVVVLVVVLGVIGLLGWFAGGVLAAAGCGGG
jgi:hypothetical protein